jgi:hypothetical protein
MARIGGFLCPYFITQRNSLAMIGVIVLVVSVVTAECSRRLPETAGKAMGEYGLERDNDEDAAGVVAAMALQESDTIHGTRNNKRGRVRRREIMTQSSSSVSNAAANHNTNGADGCGDDVGTTCTAPAEPATSYQQIL